MAPEARLMVSLIEPEPLRAQVAPAEATQVQVAAVKAAGNVSVISAPTTADGPLLVATMVYTMPVPGTSASTPSVLVMARSAVGTRVSVSVAASLPAGSVTVAGAVTVAVLVRVPVAVDEIVAVMV